MKNENSLTAPRQINANGLACLFWWTVTGIVGIPLTIAGIVLGLPKLQGVWGYLANKCVHTFHTVQISPLAVPTTVIDFLQHPLDEKNLLNIAYRNDGHYLRFVRHVGEGGIISRIDLSMIIRGELSALGLEDSLASALSYTMRQMDAGVFRTWVKYTPGQAPASVVAPASSAVATAAPIAPTAPLASAEKMESIKEAMPLAHPSVPAEPTPSSVKDKPKTMAALRHTHAVTGVVTFAGIKRFDEVGGKSYDSFVARIKCADGSEADFSGIELEKEFSTNGYSQGDRLTIRKLPSKLIHVSVGGQTVKRQRNSFEVTRA